MKIGIAADTGDFDKGVKKVKQEMWDLSKVSKDAFNSIGAAVGVDTVKLTQFSNALQGLGIKLQQTGNSGAQAFGSILKSIGPVAAGIAGLGIAGAVTAFRALKGEAEAFGNTIDGLNLKLSTQAYIDTYRQALHDANSETGKSVGEVMADWQKGWAKFKSNVTATFVQWVAGEDTVGLGEAWRKVSASIEEATAAAERNEARGDQLADVMKRELEVRKEVADIDVQIAEQRRIIRDRSEDVKARSEAEAQLRELITQKTQKQTAIAQELYELSAAMDDEAGSSYEDMAKVVSLYENWKAQIASASDQLAMVDRYANSIKTATDDTAKNIARISALRASGNEIGAIGSATMTGQVQAPVQFIADQRNVNNIKELAAFEFGGMKFTIDFEMDAEKWQQIAERVGNGIKNAVSSATVAMGQAVGQLIGDLATGQDAWGNFANSAISAFGDMAISLGKIAIEAGAEVIALNAALSSMSVPAAYMAIAAGTALVILGAAVKSGMSNIARGNYSAGAGAVSSGSSYSSSLGSFEQRDVYVNVTGTLRADGNQLVAVLNNTNKKNNVTT